MTKMPESASLKMSPRIYSRTEVRGEKEETEATGKKRIFLVCFGTSRLP